MFKDTKAMLYYLFLDHRSSILIFWGIFIGSILAILTITTAADTSVMVVSPSLPILIFCGIAGFVMVKESLPFCIKMGMTRKSFLTSVFLFNILLAAGISIIQAFVNALFRLVIDITSTQVRIFSTIEATTMNSTWYNQLLFDCILCFFLLSAGLLLGSVFYRTGLIGGASVIAFLFGLFLFSTTRDWIVELFVKINDSFQVTPNLGTISVLAVLTVIPTWLLLRKASTISYNVR
ncbi:hypothetical protein [Priestia flexa]|uniref:hypothetical protein n=1 Tax=Priestia flexa TaxID=86664 RepID=UPI00249135E3|nr:hypothetical protein [Priestia flexa]